MCLFMYRNLKTIQNDKEKSYLEGFKSFNSYEKCKETYKLNLDYLEYVEYAENSLHYLTLDLNEKTSTSISNVSNIIKGNYALILRSIQSNMKDANKEEQTNKNYVAYFCHTEMLKNIDKVCPNLKEVVKE